MSLTILALFGAIAGFIHPPTAFLPRSSRAKAFGIWMLIAVVFGIVFNPEVSDRPEDSIIGTSLIMISMLAAFVWPITAVVMLIKYRRTASASKPANRALSFDLRTTAETILADDKVHQKEAELLLSLLDQQDIQFFDPLCRELHQVLIHSLEDGYLDETEAEEIKAILSEICDIPSERPSAKSEPEKKKRPIKPSVKAEQKKPAKSIKAVKPIQQKPSRLISSGDELSFFYIDSKGVGSDRVIVYRSHSFKDDTLYIKGVCLYRNALRTFRADRMESACFADTGEIITDLDSAFQ